MPVLESNFYGLWVGKQTAKGTPNAAPSKRLVQVGGNLVTNRDDGEENYSDLTKYGNRTDWVNSISGSGEPVLEATPDELAYMLWLHHGAETVSTVAAVAGPPATAASARHRFTPSVGIGHYFTASQRVGQSVLRRHSYADCLSTKFVLEVTSANKAMRYTPTIFSQDPGATFATDPAAALPTDRPFLFTDAAVNLGGATDGGIVIDGATFRGVTAWNLTVDDAWSGIYGDDTRPYDVQQGAPSVQVGTTVYMDAAGFAQWNKMHYGTTTPAAGTKPLRGIAALGSFSAALKQRAPDGSDNGRRLTATVPGVKWTVPDATAPNPDGGTTELALTGTMRTVAGQPAYTIDVETNPATVAFTS